MHGKGFRPEGLSSGRAFVREGLYGRAFVRKGFRPGGLLTVPPIP